ncbi:nuclear transport factor 2 family protein [Patulibacter defluvii]|uniref:nuclear transport factor 2 family protein n=1 Tax=Patulibacter defluvii TaxID=3095358 RepID=UPI002A759D5A|nr:nuclear transport factor 2 family protein [Patulibacter sp. DM4]
MTSIDFARTWAETRTSDLDAHAALYAEDQFFTIEERMVDDHLGDTISDREDLRTQLAPYVNRDRDNGLGVQTLTVTEAFAGNGHLMIHWDWSVEGLETFHGLPVEGRTLTSKGSTFLQFDDDGKITLESTFLNENPVFQQLGLPIITPHYWEEGFDPASLTAG